MQHRSERWWQRGESRLGGILWILGLVILIALGYQIIPAKIATAELKDHIADLAERNPHKEQAYYEKAILDRAAELDLPLEKSQISVRKSPQRIVASVDFSITVDLMIYSFEWPLGFKVDREIFIV
jgi:hypothetical protein